MPNPNWKPKVNVIYKSKDLSSMDLATYFRKIARTRNGTKKASLK